MKIFNKNVTTACLQAKKFIKEVSESEYKSYSNKKKAQRDYYFKCLACLGNPRLFESLLYYIESKQHNKKSLENSGVTIQEIEEAIIYLKENKFKSKTIDEEIKQEKSMAEEKTAM